MKGLLIFPPQWYPGNPYPAVPLFLGQLKRAGFAAKGLDINIGFYNYILTKSYLDHSVKRSKELLASYSDELTESMTSKSIKHSIISNYVSKNADKLRTIPDEIELAVKTLKCPELFYNPERLFKSKEIIYDALKIASLPFAPAELSFANYYNPAAISGYDEMKAECYNSDTNIFMDYFSEIIDSIVGEKADYIIISAVDMTQLVAAFTLSRMLKERSRTPICIGGNIVTKLIESFKKHQDIFDTFCDFMSYGDGENSLVAFAGYFAGDIAIRDVSGLIYRSENGEICDNGVANETDLNDAAIASYDDFSLNQYFSPEPVFSVQLSKGCYWGKCSFCDVSYDKKRFCSKSPQKAVEEFEFIKERYNVQNFVLSDDSVSPEYYSELSNQIIRKGLDINIFSWMRLENGFTYEVLSKMHKAGCRMAFWGYESESVRVMTLINKGIDYNKRLEVLENAKEAGIWNHVAFMVGFPTETEAEAMKTLETISRNGDIIDSCYISKFSFKKNAAISKCPEKYTISSYEAEGEFLLDYDYRSEGMTKADKKNFNQRFKSGFLQENSLRLWPMLCVDFEHLLLYLSYYGRDWVKDYRLKEPPGSGFMAGL